MTWLIDALEVANYDTISDGKIYLGDLSANESIRYSRSLSYWTQSGTGGSMSTGTITVDNVDGTYDSLLTEDNRDRLVVVTKNGITAITGIIEGVEAPDDRTIRFRLKDVLSRLDRPIQRLTYGSEADSAVQGRVLPILFGIGRNIRPTLYDAVDASFGPGYRVADFSLSGATNVRDSGIELDPNASPPQWTFDSRISNAGLIIDVEPAGVLTCDASTSGADQYSAYLDFKFYSETLIDRSFTGSTGFRSTALNPFPSSDLPSNWGRVRTPDDEGVSGDPYKIEYVDALKMTSAESDTAFIWLYTADSSSPEGDIVTDLESGKTYRAIIEIESLIGGGVRNTKGNFRLRLSGSERILLDISASRGQFADNTFVADFTVTEGSDQGLILAVEGDGIEVIIRRVEVFEADTPAIDSVSGITLSDFMQEVILRADESITKLYTDDLDDIAGGTPAEIGYYSEQPVTALSVMRNALDSYTADVYSDRSGNIRFSQLRDPALTNTSFLIDRERLLAPPRVRVDDAPGLTTQMVAKKNNYEFRDSDFADNLTAIPLETRQAYTQAGQANAEATVPTDFPSIYSHAIDAEPLMSVFDTLSDAETEIQRVVDLYDEPRFIVDVEVALDEDEYVDLDDVVLLEYPRWGFDAGVNFLVVGVDDEISGKHGKRSARLRLWGSTGKNYTPAQPTAPSAIIDVLATEADDILTTESEELIGVTQ